MRKFRSPLSNRAKSGSAAVRKGSRQLFETLEQRTLLSAAVANALTTTATPHALTSASASPFVGTQMSQTNMIIAPGTVVTFGTSVQFTVVVSDPSSAGTPTGNVIITDNGTPLNGATGGAIDGTGTLSFSLSTLSAGFHNIIATYGGDPTYAGSSAGPVQVSVDSITVSGPTPSAFGTPIQFTATVAPASAAGTVDFFADGVQFGTAIPVSGGVATSPAISTLSGGPHNITATFNATDPTTYASPLTTPSPFVETINGAPSTTTVTSGTPTSVYGTPVTFTATVTPAGATGTVQFLVGGVAYGGPVTLSAGVAQLTTTVANPLPAGTDQITATYSGDPTYAGSTSMQFTETVSTAASMTTLSVSPSNSVTVGTSVIFTATVASVAPGLPAPTGTVTFEDGGVPLGMPVALAGGSAMSPAITSLAVGMHNITAIYNPAADYSSSTSAPLVETVTQGTPTVTVTPSMNPAPFGTNVTFTATVAGVMGAPTPTTAMGMGVTFMDGMTVLAANVPLVAGVATFSTSTLTVGMHPISVSYPGDANYVAASTLLPLVEDIGVGATTTTLTAVPGAPVSFTTPVTFTASVAPVVGGGPALTGTVSFFAIVGGNPNLIAGPTPVDAMGNASFTTAALPVGTSMIQAVYSGDANYATSTSATTNYNVSFGTSTTFLSSALGTINLGGSTLLTATVVPNVTGTVQFFDNGVAISGAVPLIGSNATFTFTSNVLGNHNLTATYSGNAMYGASTSNTVIESVVGTSSTVTLSALFTSIAIGSSDTFTAMVVPPGPGLPTPTGTITFTENGSTVLGVVTIDATGSATISTSLLALGTDTILATYSGDANFGASTSNPVAVGVTPITSNTSVTDLTADTSTIPAGGSVNFTATVASALGIGAVPTGNVTFYQGVRPISAPVTLNPSGVATLTSTLPTGSINVYAVYSGASSGYSMSHSSMLNEAVGIGTRSDTQYNTNLGVTSNSVPFATPVTITATVSPTISGGPSPAGGTVTFINGRVTLKSVVVGVDGTATYTVTLPAGTNNITAVYSGGKTLSVSAPMQIVVASSAIPTLGLTVLPSSAVAGGPFNVKVPLVVTNHGPTLHGKFTFNIYADTATSLDANKALVKTMTMFANLQTGQARIFNINLRSLPIGLPSGQYYIVAEIIDPTGGANTAPTPTTVNVAAAVITPVASVDIVTPGTLKVGSVASLLVTVTNNGNTTANGPLIITLSPSSDGVNPLGITLATYTLKSIVVPVGKPRTFRLNFRLKAGLAPGMYSPLVTVSLAGASTTVVGATKFTVS